MPEALLLPLANLGVAGVMIWWFATQTTSRLDRIERALDRLSRATTLEVLSRSTASEPVKRRADELLKELDDVSVKRNGRRD